MKDSATGVLNVIDFFNEFSDALSFDKFGLDEDPPSKLVTEALLLKLLEPRPSPDCCRRRLLLKAELGAILNVAALFDLSPTALAPEPPLKPLPRLLLDLGKLFSEFRESRCENAYVDLLVETSE